ncbi:hypothetical protein BVRB_007260 [Beta vulgaris subsp. vulgaris]|uniref:Uncharacterized protein n=1 Tax=Beta vulgaris subsp. vulgaris TaxID=3555 RepID=A0A0J8B6Z4_BETVV|nr:hypothetical protein BVRB_007260 [Beta vulgaris subsp. vulgaris]
MPLNRYGSSSDSFTSPSSSLWNVEVQLRFHFILVLIIILD